MAKKKDLEYLKNLRNEGRELYYDIRDQLWGLYNIAIQFCHLLGQALPIARSVLKKFKEFKHQF